MKKILVIILIGISLLSFSQENYMSLCFVGNSPIGNFSSNKNLLTDGFAKTGFGGEYSGAYFFSKYIGVGGNIKYISNTVDDNAVKQLLVDEIPDDFPVENAQFGIGLWKQVSFVGGPYISLPMEKISLDVFTLIGLNIIMPPEMRVSATIDDEIFERSLSVQSINYAFDLGIALRYHIDERYSIRLFSSYYQSNSKGKVKEELDENGDGNRESTETNQSVAMQSVNFGIGIVYRL
jgi:hypothetical protein